MPRSPTLPALVGALLLLGACQGVIADPAGAPAGGGGGPTPDDPYVPGSAEPLRCAEGDFHPTEAPLRRLTPHELERSLADLFPGVALPPLALPSDGEVDGFDNNALGQAVTPLFVERLAEGARAVADAAVADPSWLPCDPVEAGCGATVASSLGERAYRRPLSEEERARLVAFFDAAEAELGSFDEGLGAFIEGLVQSPDFLYRPELGDGSLPAPDGLVALAGPEVATRLSYLLWQAPPDDALREAAADGDLATPEGIEAEARRMLADPRAAEAVRRFHAQWMRLDRIAEIDLSAERFPELDGALRRDLEASAEAYLEHAFREGSFRELFTGRTGFVNDRLAPLFGVAPPGTDELVPVTLPTEERAGLLTQPGVLASTSHGLSHSPILRGVLVLDAVLCAPPPPPPAEVDIGVAEEEPGGEAVTTREKIELTHGTSECAVCHDAIDGMGFSFERYDALGRFRTTENGVEVDPTGRLREREVADAVELAEALADDAQVQRCVATQWFRYALGRSEARADACTLQDLADTLEETDDPEEMLVRLVTSPAFRFRPETP
ncbi:MAG TPA: DUF1592 domain-containing protein [Polyangiaceae bacterium LLY-WYZ-15_(1-7)]|nr:DUF1592 domain-containing protein [Polyangiaceae bacterium LLY-WYZ-15_(1-7)]